MTENIMNNWYFCVFSTIYFIFDDLVEQLFELCPFVYNIKANSHIKCLYLMNLFLFIISNKQEIDWGAERIMLYLFHILRFLFLLFLLLSFFLLLFFLSVFLLRPPTKPMVRIFFRFLQDLSHILKKICILS